MAKDEEVVSITSAAESRTDAVWDKERRYVWTMLVRTACFLAGALIDHPIRWLFFAGAVFLPWIAVVIGNQVSRRSSEGPSPFGHDVNRQLEK